MPPALPQLMVTEPASSDHLVDRSEEQPSPIPPSPVSSSDAHSAAPLTSMALRHHDPAAVYSSNKLEPTSHASHARSPSGSSLASMVSTVPDENTSDTLHEQQSSPASYGAKKQRSLDVEAGRSPAAPQSDSAKPKKTLARKIMFWRKDESTVEAEEDVEEDRRIPDPTPEQMGRFTILPSQLDELFNPKSMDNLVALGGVDGIEQKLFTSAAEGLSDSSKDAPNKEQRTQIYGVNELPQRPIKSLLQLMWIAFQDKVLIILTVAAVVSLALGIYTTVGTPAKVVNGQKEPQVDWVEGLAIIIAIIIVVMVGSLNDWQKERQFKKLNEKKEDRSVKCVRDGSERLMSVHEVVVGDILVLEPGEVVPVDGVFISGFNVKCDESSATGESDAIRKLSYHELTKAGNTSKADPFVISGSKVLEGSGKYIVTSVGQHSSFGRIMTALNRKESAPTPLQSKLNNLAELIAKLGALAGLVLFVALLIRFLAQLPGDNGTSDEKAQNFINILIIAVTIIVVAVPEGLPLAVTLALAFATRRMTKENLLVRVLSSCEIMANATVICTDKTGTLTQNKMSVVAGSIGVHAKFVHHLAEHQDRANANDDLKEGEKGEKMPAPKQRAGRKDFSLDMEDISKILTGPLRKVFNDSVALNSQAFEGVDEHGNQGFVGSKTETALLSFCKQQGWTPFMTVRKSADIKQALPFDSTRKASAVVVKLHNGKHRFYVKGASEILQKASTKHVHVANPASQSFTDLDRKAADDGDEGEIKTVEFTEETKANVERTIIFYANQCLRTIALCYRDFAQWPPTGMNVDEEGQVDYNDLCQELTLLAITAIEDPLREGVTESVRSCQQAGVAVKMCTGDNVLTARSIASQCGIYSAGGLIMEGPQFRKLSKEERREIAPRLQVLARSSPDDKYDLVEALQSQHEIVGVTGDGTNDGPALKLADVGFSMGIAGTEVAKEASDIILMDDNFASIVTAIIWGRCVNDSVKKFLQFQLSVNIVAVLLTFITAVASSSETSVLTAVQLLWVNLIMDTFAALALATDPASRESLKRKPEPKHAGLLTVDMWKMIIGQSCFQLTVTLVLHFAGHRIFSAYSDDPITQTNMDRELSTLVFNTFVFCQIFNQLNSRVLGRDLNILAGFWRNYYFLVIFAIMTGGQVLIVYVGGAAFSVHHIPGKYWAVSIVIGLVSLPIGALIRLIPNGPCIVIGNAVTKPLKAAGHALAKPWNSLLLALHLRKRSPDIGRGDEERGAETAPVNLVVDNLEVLSKLRGGRLRSSSVVQRSRHQGFEQSQARLKEHGIKASELSALALVPGMIFGSVGGGGLQNQVGSLDDPAAHDPSASSTALFRGQAQMHPETNADDPLLRRYRDVTPAIVSTPTGSPRLGSQPHLTPPASPSSHRRTGSAASRMTIPSSPVQTIPEEDRGGEGLRPPQA